MNEENIQMCPPIWLNYIRIHNKSSRLDLSFILEITTGRSPLCCAAKSFAVTTANAFTAR